MNRKNLSAPLMLLPGASTVVWAQPSDTGPSATILAANETGRPPAVDREADGRVVLEASGTRVAIDQASGRLVSVERDGRAVALANGPRIIRATTPASTGQCCRRRRRCRSRGCSSASASEGPQVGSREVAFVF